MLSLLIAFSAAVSMRGPEGTCSEVRFCWDGSVVDPVDCFCPDAPIPIQTNSTAGSVCLQKKCWDDSKPNVYDCSCPPRPAKNVTDHFVDPPYVPPPTTTPVTPVTPVNPVTPVTPVSN